MVQREDILRSCADVICYTQRSIIYLHDHPHPTRAWKRIGDPEVQDVDEERVHTVVQELLEKPAGDRSKKVLKAIRARLVAAGSQVTKPRKFLYFVIMKDWDRLTRADNRVVHKHDLGRTMRALELSSTEEEDEEIRIALQSMTDYTYYKTPVLASLKGQWKDFLKSPC